MLILSPNTMFTLLGVSSAVVLPVNETVCNSTNILESYPCLDGLDCEG